MPDRLDNIHELLVDRRRVQPGHRVRQIFLDGQPFEELL